MGRIIEIMTWAIPAVILAALGWFLGTLTGAEWGMPVLLVCVWTAILFALGVTIVNKQGYLVIERFGKFQAVKYNGIRWINPFFSQIKEEGSLRVHTFKLYTDDGAEIDFACGGTAKVHAKASYMVGNPDDVRNEDWSAVTLQIIAWTYLYKDSVGRVSDVYDSALRPLVQALSIDEASTAQGDVACKTAVDVVTPLLAEIGAFRPAEKALILEDIELPDAVIEARQQELVAKGKAAADALIMQGPADGVLAVQAALKAKGCNMTVPQIIEWQLTSRGLDVIRDAKANVTFVASDVEGILRTLNVGGKGGN